MTTYITIDGETFPTNTTEEIAEASRALFAAGLATAPVYAGEPDGEGDSHRNGQTVYADAPDAAIEALRFEAITAGDNLQADQCARALRGVGPARLECVRALLAARAMAD